MKTEDYGWTDAVSHCNSYINRAVLEAARKANAQSILDVGCGNGTLVADLARAGFSVAGMDGDEGGIEIARRKYPDLSFEVGRFENTPDRQYDFVVSTEVVEHLYSPQQLIRYCFDALEPQGTLVISTPYHGYLKNAAVALSGKWDHHHHPLRDGGHVKFFSRDTLTELLEDGGFVVKDFTGVGRLPLLWKSMILTAKKRWQA